ncbi:MFS transporter [Hoeflea sp.]|uniref:MFS transporter n=1 Tax=Hoeflea sp. TaxID=1940281 RepID=UPI003B01F466
MTSQAAPANGGKAERRWRVLAVTAVAVVLSLTSWFSATAVINDLSRDWNLDAATAGWLTNAVQLGFVTGALVSSLLAISDIVALPRLMAGSALLAAISSAVLLVEPGFSGAVFARFVTGAALAGVYPPAMKFIATWFKTGRGVAMGAMVGALTLGSAGPHLVRALGQVLPWETVIAVTAICCLISAVIFLLLREGPYGFARARVDPRQVAAIIRNRPVMLANFGYFGHMWELYAMWGWILAYVIAASESGAILGNASLLAFAVVAMGAPGCLLGGFLSDMIGRCYTTALMMAVSGLCALAIGFLFDGPAGLFLAVALIWGLTVVADSAQFSAAVSELSDASYVGSSLAFQMGVGFAITTITIWLVPVIADMTGSWRWTFLVLVPGPFLGVISMLALRRMPEAAKIANGLR